MYPKLSEPEAKVQRTSLFIEIPITQKQREDDDLKAQLESIQSYLKVVINPTQIKQWGMCPLPTNITLTSQLFELSKKAPSHGSRYFEAQLRDVTQPKYQSNDETEIEVEVTKPIFGEALAFYTVAETNQHSSTRSTNLSLHPSQELGTMWLPSWKKRWPMVCVLWSIKLQLANHSTTTHAPASASCNLHTWLHDLAQLHSPYIWPGQELHQALQVRGQSRQRRSA